MKNRTYSYQLAFYRRIYYLLIFILFFLKFSGSNAQVDLRYPYRIPDWLWKDQMRSAFIDDSIKTSLDSSIKKMDEFYHNKNNTKGDSIELYVMRKLKQTFSLQDLSIGSYVSKTSPDINISLQLDPAFKENDKSLLKSALELFSRVALDDEVINEAFLDASPRPKPMPIEYDSTNMKKYTSDYTQFLACRAKPFSQNQFKKQLTSALTTFTGDPSLLIVSSYSGNGWWGGAYYNYYYSGNQSLSKFAPNQGYLYIRLNKDSLQTNRSPEFWASKIAHEVLHNLGYWHPNYKDSIERDLNNQKEKAFIVAYEFAILKKARKLSLLKKKI